MKIGVSLAWQNYDWNRYETGDFTIPPPVADDQVFRENVQLADLVEPLGFDSLFVVEHHMTGHHMTPSGLQLLTYYAGRYPRIDLGTCVIVLPWDNAVRTAEQISFLDNMLDGDRKLWLGFGRGSAPREFASMSSDMNTARERFMESLDIVELALTNDIFDYSGKFYDLKDISIRPHARSKDLLDRIYWGVASPPSLEIAAHRGPKLIFVGAKPWTECEADVQRFNDIRAEDGREPMNPICVIHTYCCETEEEALDGAERYIGNYLDGTAKHYGFDKPAQFADIKGYEHYAGASSAIGPGGGGEQAEVEPAKGVDSGHRPAELSPEFLRGNFMVGTPEQCYEKLQWMAEHLKTDQVVLLGNMGMMPVEKAEKSLRLFAKEVLPEAQKLMPAAFAAA
jgi:alkanesulfonate monooxygenase SsuD/methylene tetrahydromethanopterin reductase-like flavin-dependent oxidoreductase (luciferase family)